MDATTAPLPVVELTPMGDANAAVCEGDFCAIPEGHTQVAVNRKLDEDAV